MTTVAVLLVKHPEVFTWLGHMPVLSWCLEQLRDVRGIDSICCAAVPSLLSQAKKLLEPVGVPVTEIADTTASVRPIVQARKLLTAADNMLCVVPTLPFLPAGKIEACVRAVSDGKHTLATVARLTNVLFPMSGQGATTRKLPALLGAVWIESPKVAVANEERWKNFQIVEVTLLEALDVRDSDNLLMAQAVVNAN